MNRNITIELYSRPGCHLCDEAKSVIERVGQRLGFAMRVINVESDPELERQYGNQIPVVFINGQEAFNYHVDEAELENRVRGLWKS
jgi:glutaredoxin